ncbi:PhoU domain-containing protein [Nanoarchaeota archaeon]
MSGSKMEYRKIIEFGKSSFVVSLPKPWLKERNLGKGDVVYVSREGENLTLYSAQKKESNEPKRITLDVTNMTKREIQLHVISKYIRNFNEITLTAENMGSKAKDVRAIIHDLMALEVYEEDANRIVAKDFLNVEDICPMTLLKKMDGITREMISDSKNMFKEDAYDSIRQRDDDINRLSHLLSRVLRYLQENHATARRKGLKNPQMNAIWAANTNIEHVADQVKWVTKLMRKVKFKKSEQEEFLKLFSAVEKYYLDGMQALYGKDGDLAFKLLTRSKPLIKQCKDFNRQNWNHEHVPVMMEKLKTLVGEVKSILIYLCDVE